MEYYSAIKKNVIMPFAPIWIGSRDCHTEWNKSDSEGEISYDIPYMYNLKRNDTNKLKKQKETQRLGEQTYGCGVGGGMGGRGN